MFIIYTSLFVLSPYDLVDFVNPVFNTNLASTVMKRIHLCGRQDATENHREWRFGWGATELTKSSSQIQVKGVCLTMWQQTDLTQATMFILETEKP